MTDNEMAKLHIRHLVGGRAPERARRNPLPLRVPRAPRRADEFPRPRWAAAGISRLFHYRSHGADFGRVLVGMQVPAKDKAKFRKFLGSLGYEYVEETGNPAYKLFLS